MDHQIDAMDELIKASTENPFELRLTDVQQQVQTDVMRFTTHTGKVFELRPKDVIQRQRNISSSMDGYLVLDGTSSPPPESVYLSPHTGVAVVPPRAIPDDKGLNSMVEEMKMDYNEYGELVDIRTLRNPPKSSEMTPLQILRIIKRAFHHDFRTRLGVMLIPQSTTVPQGWAIEESGRRIWRGPLTVWDFNTAPSDDANDTESNQIETPRRRMANNEKPPRVLELGCSDGHWCYKLKKENPSWIIEGVDDTDHWACISRDMPPRDFMYYDYDVNRFPESEDYFSRTPQQYPEFTKRNLNRLLDHERPLPLETYGLIRAREIFDRVESYKTFIEDLFKLLEPGGVVEFVEIDPRPRVGTASAPKPEEKKSGLAVGWTDKIADRFQEPPDTERLDAEARAPGWVERVNERLRAGLRPLDGVPAANLKDWLSAGGFNDLTETKVKMPVGGETRAGNLMVDFIRYQLELENEMQQLKENLPQIEMDQIYSGEFYINLHLITGRKPMDRRMGDMRRDGRRQYMTDEKYDRMAAEEAEHGYSQWKRARSFRFALDIKLTNMIGNLSTLHGGPDHVAPPPESTGNTPSTASPNYRSASKRSP